MLCMICQAFHVSLNQVDKCAGIILRSLRRNIVYLDYAKHLFQPALELSIVVSTGYGKCLVCACSTKPTVKSKWRKLHYFITTLYVSARGFDLVVNCRSLRVYLLPHKVEE